MPNKKKKIFTKDNSVKFLLLHGNSKATNADGDTLENVFVPIGKNYKPGTSLLMSNIAALCNIEDPGKAAADLENIIDQFEDSDSVTISLQSGIKQLSVDNKGSEIFVEDCYDDKDDFSDVDSQFSDVSDDSFHESIKLAAAEAYKNCPENLQILNARFEKVFEEYDEDQIGALDDEDICGNLSTDCKRVQNLFDTELKQEEEVVLDPCDEKLKEKILNYAEDSEEEKIVEIVTERPLEFDCESILSTFSNKYNHPTVIKEDTVKKMRIPRNPLKKGLKKSQLKALDNENDSSDESDYDFSVDSFNMRVKGETPEERRERKNLFKEAKRESRMLKKENKLAFKREKKVQTAQSLNVQRTKGIKLL